VRRHHDGHAGVGAHRVIVTKQSLASSSTRSTPSPKRPTALIEEEARSLD
jgi:hypothetical protein